MPTRKKQNQEVYQDSKPQLEIKKKHTLSSISDEDWKHVSTAISADILDNKILLSSSVLKEIFTGNDSIDNEDLLIMLVLPLEDWESYINRAIKEGKAFDLEMKNKLSSIKAKEKIFFCRVCDFEGLQAEFNYDIESDVYSCPECTSLSLGIRRFIEEE